jgi:hypothetical protein
MARKDYRMGCQIICAIESIKRIYFAARMNLLPGFTATPPAAQSGHSPGS